MGRKKGWRMRKEKQLSISHTRYAAKMLEAYIGHEFVYDPYMMPFAG